MNDVTPPPAGWYPDPEGPGLKYWDGSAWTDHVAPDPSAPRWQQETQQSQQGYPPPDPQSPGQVPPPGAPGQAPQGYPGYPGSTQPGYPTSGYTPYPSPGQPARTDSNTLSIIGIVCGGLAFLICPILLGPAGIILGAVAMSKGERLGKVALGVSVAGLVLGLVISALVWSSYTYS